MVNEVFAAYDSRWFGWHAEEFTDFALPQLENRGRRLAAARGRATAEPAMDAVGEDG